MIAYYKVESPDEILETLPIFVLCKIVGDLHLYKFEDLEEYKEFLFEEAGFLNSPWVGTGNDKLREEVTQELALRNVSIQTLLDLHIKILHELGDSLVEVFQ